MYQLFYTFMHFKVYYIIIGIYERSIDLSNSIVDDY